MALRQTLVGAAAIALSAALYNGVARGDEPVAKPAKNSSQIEEITVTAEKRTEDVRDVPASISVLSGADIEAQHITDITDLTRSVPDLSFSGNAGQGPGLSNLEIRGISSAAGSATVGVYLDDVSMTTRNLYTDGSAEPLFFDVARIEVLRGPQGTLYGASSMGGTIKFVTNQPDLDSWGGSVYSTVSGTDHGGVNFTQNGVLNVPIIKGELALRIGAEFINNDGYIDQVSPSTGAVIAPGINTEHGQALHLSLKWQPDPSLTVTPALWYQRVSTGDIDNSYLNLPLDETAKLVREPGNDRLLVPSVTVNKDLGFADVTSVTSYFYRNFDRTQDATTSDVPYLASQIPNPALAAVVAGLPAAAYLNTTVRQYSEELRIASKPYDPNGTGLPITWVAGLYYADEHTTTSDTEPVIGINAAFASFGENVNNPNDIAYGYPGDFPGESSYISNRRYDTRQYAVFGEGNYYLSPTLRVTAGLRYLYARDNLNRVGDAWYVGGLTLDSSTERSYAATPKFAVTWDVTPDETLYANAAKGFRLGGPNRPVPIDGETIADLQTLHLAAAPANYAPDSLWNYEIGSKSRFFDNRLSVDVTGFYIDWKKHPAGIRAADQRLRPRHKCRHGRELRPRIRHQGQAGAGADLGPQRRLHPCHADQHHSRPRRAERRRGRRRAGLERQVQRRIRLPGHGRGRRLLAGQYRPGRQQPWRAAAHRSRLRSSGLLHGGDQHRHAIRRLGGGALRQEPVEQRQSDPKAVHPIAGDGDAPHPADRGAQRLGDVLKEPWGRRYR
ncbi:MAG: TonB-dependent receptor [Aliidongia sp.]